MTTPVLFLDDASRHTGTVDRTRAEQTAMTLLETLRHLRKINRRLALNAARPITQYQIADDWTLQAVLGGNAFKEEWEFVKALSDRAPFSAELSEGISQEIDGMEFRTRQGQVLSSALAWATLLDSATVGFDAHPDWSQAWVETAFRQLDDEGNLIEAEGRVRNASQVAHVDAHVDWLKLLGLSSVPTAAQTWSERGNRFPGLRFLPRVENDLMELEGSGMPFLRAVTALEALERAVASWPPDTHWPQFSPPADPEALQRQNLCWTHDDATGKNELFDWHTRFRCVKWPGRVHFRVDGAARLVVVAYIGRKLSRPIAG